MVPGNWLLATGKGKVEAEGLTIGDFGFRIWDLLKGFISYFYNEKTALRWKAEGERLTAEGIKSDIFPYSNPKSAIPNLKSKSGCAPAVESFLEISCHHTD